MSFKAKTSGDSVTPKKKVSFSLSPTISPDMQHNKKYEINEQEDMPLTTRRSKFLPSDEIEVPQTIV